MSLLPQPVSILMKSKTSLPKSPFCKKSQAPREFYCLTITWLFRECIWTAKTRKNARSASARQFSTSNWAIGITAMTAQRLTIISPNCTSTTTKKKKNRHKNHRKAYSRREHKIKRENLAKLRKKPWNNYKNQSTYFIIWEATILPFSARSTTH